MHPCLNVDEIVRLIARELVASKAGATAAALACCSKGFEDPVLDALWGSQTRLLPLFRSLPEEVFKPDEWKLTFKRHPTALEWARLQKYARKIRKLEGPGFRDGLSEGVLNVLQIRVRVTNQPLFPNIRALYLWPLDLELVPFVSLFLSSATTDIMISIGLLNPESSVFPAVASMITSFPTLCPNLQSITVYRLPRDPKTISAVSEMILATNRSTLRRFHVESPLTKEAREVVHELSDLRGLSVVIERDAPLPSAVLPSLTHLLLKYDRDGDWRPIFHGATFGNLESVAFHSESEKIGDFVEAIENVRLATSTQKLSRFSFRASCRWTPNYSSLLPFTQLTTLVIAFSCNGGCSSNVDDSIITDIAQAMPKLNVLRLGGFPCNQILTGVTARGLVVLANHCPDLFSLCVHFQVASFSDLAPDMNSNETASNAGPAPLRSDCGLVELEIGDIPLPEESVLVAASILARIFPRIEEVVYVNQNWRKVMDVIHLSRRPNGFPRTATAVNQ